MNAIERRIDALERADSSDKWPKTILVNFLQPGESGPGIVRIRSFGGLQEWVRRDADTEQEFIDRASREVDRSTHGVALLFQCE